MMRRFLDRLTFDEWRGALDGRVTLWSRDLWAWRGWRVSLHRMVGADDPGCFHTHPAHAVRMILAGGYVEEIEGGRGRAWLPGMVGHVRPDLSHRIAVLVDGVSYSLWLRAPKSAEIALRGPGWVRPAGATLTPNRRREVVENLRDEFDLLCLGMPSQHQIDAALRMAEARP